MIVGRVRRLLFGISPRETEFERRGFHARSSPARRRLEASGGAFVAGYNAGLGETDLHTLERRLHTVTHELQGFAFEGAAMALALLDELTPWRRTRLPAFLDGPGRAHVYMVHVGAGWAWARLRRNPIRALARLDPVLGWLAVDGYGFHQVFFNPDRYVHGQAPDRAVTGYARRVFDQGVGRAMWFVFGGDIEKISGAVARFEPARHADLWSGTGLASAYAGGVDESDLIALFETAAGFESQLAQGAAFAAKARELAGNPTPHTDLACRVFWGFPAGDAARLTDAMSPGLPETGPEPAFEVWRQRIQQRHASLKEARA